MQFNNRTASRLEGQQRYFLEVCARSMLTCEGGRQDYPGVALLPIAPPHYTSARRHQRHLIHGSGSPRPPTRLGFLPSTLCGRSP